MDDDTLYTIVWCGKCGQRRVKNVRQLFYEDLVVGMRVITPARTIIEDDLLIFAKVSGDAHPLHVDEAYAATTEFGRRIAHGPFGIALAIGRFCLLQEFDETALMMLDVKNWKFLAPIFIGDHIHLDLEISDKRLTRAGRGIVGRHFRLIKADGSLAQEGHSAMVVKRRAEFTHF